MGVRSGVAVDKDRDERRLPFEVWYPEDAHLFTRGRGLAHFDEVLKEDPAAGAFMAGDLVTALRDREVQASYPEPLS